jgi:hypothetical protein
VRLAYREKSRYASFAAPSKVKYLKSVQGNQKGMGCGPAPLVAVRCANGASQLLTFNVAHFARLAGFGPGVVVVDPASV